METQTSLFDIPAVPGQEPAKNYQRGNHPQPTPIINPDGVSVKGCNIIYAPQGQAGEYAPLAANPYRFCGIVLRRCTDTRCQCRSLHAHCLGRNDGHGGNCQHGYGCEDDQDGKKLSLISLLNHIL